jgi:hypothetical protein
MFYIRTYKYGNQGVIFGFSPNGISGFMANLQQTQDCSTNLTNLKYTAESAGVIKYTLICCQVKKLRPDF